LVACAKERRLTATVPSSSANSSHMCRTRCRGLLNGIDAIDHLGHVLRRGFAIRDMTSGCEKTRRRGALVSGYARSPEQQMSSRISRFAGAVRWRPFCGSLRGPGRLDKMLEEEEGRGERDRTPGRNFSWTHNSRRAMPQNIIKAVSSGARCTQTPAYFNRRVRACRSRHSARTSRIRAQVLSL
jgi:hypothetical protein